jgi:hypothetical protein
LNYLFYSRTEDSKFDLLHSFTDWDKRIGEASKYLLRDKRIVDFRNQITHE